MKVKNKMKKKIRNCFCILILIACFNFVNVEDFNLSTLNNVYADTVGGSFDYNLIPKAENFSNDYTRVPVKRLWSTLILIFQIASVGGTVFAGVRYMYSSAEQKADMKKSMIHLIIGLVIVFSASTVIGIVTGTFNDILK